MSNKKALRKRFFVDPKVQGGLALRIALYWLVCLLTITLMLLCWRIITGPVRPFYTHLDDLWFFNGPAIVASLLLLPLVVVDIVRWSNRFAGPMLRLRRSMRALARGESVKPIEFRGNDFWQDFAGEFNALLKRVQEGHAPPAPEQDESVAQNEEEPVGAATA
jgi:signal transduction histidine kinase